MTLEAIFSKQMKKQVKQKDDKTRESQSGKAMMTMKDFDKIKIIGKGGFAEKVYLARKKDTGSLYAIKTMSKSFIMEE